MGEDVYVGCLCMACTGHLTPEERQAAIDADRQRQEQEAAEAARLQRERAERRAAERREQERFLAEVIACPGCKKEDKRSNMRKLRDERYFCTECSAQCYQCSRGYVRGDMWEDDHSYRTRLLCSDCYRDCHECEERFASGDLIYIRGDHVCTDCATYCDDCDSYYMGECGSCETRVRGLNSYGKTYANRWLGGPVRQAGTAEDKGYYLGFELEISANTGHVQPIYDWAQSALGYDDAMDCKEDSSVDGFEIATQPMTPQFFEAVDWNGFFDMLNSEFPLSRREEPRHHGLHVHIGRAAFAGDDIAMAAFCYLISQGNHLERVGRRNATSYCKKVDKPVSAAIKSANMQTGRHMKQARKEKVRSMYLDRDAINLMNNATIEIRAFKSTRSADELRDAVRLVYVAAEYVRSLRFGGGSVSPKALHWGAFSEWVRENYPAAFASISGKTMAGV